MAEKLSYGHSSGVIDNKKEFAKIIIPDDIITAFRLFNLRRKLQDNDKEVPVIDLSITYKNIHDGELSAMYKIGFLPITDYSNFSVYKLVAAEQEVTNTDR